MTRVEGLACAGGQPTKPRLRYPAEVFDYFRPAMGSLRSEVFHVACLDVRNTLVRNARVATGGFASCAILPREVFAPALAAGAVGVILVHNHPSGETAPSPDDLQLTHRLVRAGEVLGVRVLDHVIVGQDGFTSLAELGQLNPDGKPAGATPNATSKPDGSVHEPGQLSEEIIASLLRANG